MPAVIRIGAALLIIVVHLFAGRFASAALTLPVPGSVIGMLLLAATLRIGIIRLPHVRPATDPLLRYMALFFVPPGVGIILYFDLLAREWLPIVAATVLSTAAVLGTVGLVQQRLEKDA
jgi:holin-like protein